MAETETGQSSPHAGELKIDHIEQSLQTAPVVYFDGMVGLISGADGLVRV